MSVSLLDSKKVLVDYPALSNHPLPNVAIDTVGIHLNIQGVAIVNALLVSRGHRYSSWGCGDIIGANLTWL